MSRARTLNMATAMVYRLGPDDDADEERKDADYYEKRPSVDEQSTATTNNIMGGTTTKNNVYEDDMKTYDTEFDEDGYYEFIKRTSSYQWVDAVGKSISKSTLQIQKSSPDFIWKIGEIVDQNVGKLVDGSMGQLIDATTTTSKRRQQLGRRHRHKRRSYMDENSIIEKERQQQHEENRSSIGRRGRRSQSKKRSTDNDDEEHDDELAEMVGSILINRKSTGMSDIRSRNQRMPTSSSHPFDEADDAESSSKHDNMTVCSEVPAAGGECHMSVSSEIVAVGEGRRTGNPQRRLGRAMSQFPATKRRTSTAVRVPSSVLITQEKERSFSTHTSEALYNVKEEEVEVEVEAEEAFSPPSPLQSEAEDLGSVEHDVDEKEEETDAFPAGYIDGGTDARSVATDTRSLVTDARSVTTDTRSIALRRTEELSLSSKVGASGGSMGRGQSSSSVLSKLMSFSNTNQGDDDVEIDDVAKNLTRGDNDDVDDEEEEEKDTFPGVSIDDSDTDTICTSLRRTEELSLSSKDGASSRVGFRQREQSSSSILSRLMAFTMNQGDDADIEVAKNPSPHDDDDVENQMHHLMTTTTRGTSITTNKPPTSASKEASVILYHDDISRKTSSTTVSDESFDMSPTSQLERVVEEAEYRDYEEEGEEVSIGEYRPRSRSSRRISSALSSAVGVFRQISESSKPKFKHSLRMTSFDTKKDGPADDHVSEDGHDVKEDSFETNDESESMSNILNDTWDSKEQGNATNPKPDVFNGEEVVPAIMTTGNQTTTMTSIGIGGVDGNDCESQTSSPSITIDIETSTREEGNKLLPLCRLRRRLDLESILRWTLFVTLVLLIGIGWRYRRQNLLSPSD